MPTLVLDNGETLIESHAILDYIDSLVPEDRVMFPKTEPARHQALKIAALATGLGDKAVSLFYEKRLHKDVSEVWVNRCRGQMTSVLAALETDRKGRYSGFYFDHRIGHADIAVATMLQFVAEAHPDVISIADFPALCVNKILLETNPVFQEIKQPFIPPT